jgi:hypothetical protein
VEPCADAHGLGQAAATRGARRPTVCFLEVPSVSVLLTNSHTLQMEDTVVTHMLQVEGWTAQWLPARVFSVMRSQVCGC